MGLQIDSTFFGLGENHISKWDARTPQGVVDASQPVAPEYLDGNYYSSHKQFTCMATTGKGDLAVGSKDGSIRLYDIRDLSKAKTVSPRFKNSWIEDEGGCVSKIKNPTVYAIGCAMVPEGLLRSLCSYIDILSKNIGFHQ